MPQQPPFISSPEEGVIQEQHSRCRPVPEKERQRIRFQLIVSDDLFSSNAEIESAFRLEFQVVPSAAFPHIHSLIWLLVFFLATSK